MKMKTNTQITKAMLQEYGIHSVNWDKDNNEWWIDRYWYNRSAKEKSHRRIKVAYAVCRHKYTQDKVYPVVNFSYNNKVISLPLARFLFAWFNGEVKEGEVVDHIDNNPFNNTINNLQVLSPEENLAKRFIDNPGANRNQWDAIRGRK